MPASELLNSWTDTKLYAAEQHINRLREIKTKYGHLAHHESIVDAHIEIDECLYQLVSASDALLQEINRTLNLGLTLDKVGFGKVSGRLEDRGIKHIISDLVITDDSHWLKSLNDLHNESKHRRMNRQNTNVNLGSASRPDDFSQFYQSDGTSIVEEITDYLGNALQNMRNAVSSVRAKMSLS